MVEKRRNLKRKSGVRKYRKLYILAVEGSVTEPQYFRLFQQHSQVTVKVEILRKGKKSDPKSVLSRMKNRLKENALKKSDEAWLVIDKDNWKKADLEELHKWSQVKANYALAVSNPKFEYWLLLHFDNGDRIQTATECNRKLNQHLPNYNKNINDKYFDRKKILTAISRAQLKDNPPCKKWPVLCGTTVYRLVQRLIPEK